MDQERCNVVITTIMLLFCMLMFQSEIAHGDTYNVGGLAGWSRNIGDWTKGKQFEEGDTFVFKYDPRLHNVVKVNQANFYVCSVDGAIAIYKTGNDSLRLRTGMHYFISGVHGDCGSGIKVALHLL
ncbi:hypothetical protein TanjilG_00812 [Lupinus angustifolius]|uniref:Phytocyanin domain-containing protein n=1 Tax=Lupinus angustifolius TaxID=3871 RepID=A0A4P1R834_LUPAN|nr:PREDICTED: basic blue protein-like [Lupinus angustifolius]OIW04252.1 hypothetical protein TanjilG_00812 [Lupinus angustifolius]